MDYEMAQHPIGYVSRRTGLSTHVIRAWERRYNAVSPKRTDTTRRLYSEADIDRLKLLQSLSVSGLSIGQIANRSTAELKRLVVDLSEPDESPRTRLDIDSIDSDHIVSIMRECQSSIEAMDAKALDAALTSSRVAFSEQAILDELIGPLLTWVGDRWHEGKVRAGQEHLATVVVKSFLNQIRRSVSAGVDAPSAIISTPAGELHELGALMSATIAALEGWDAIYLGPNLPSTELANAVARRKAIILALSVAAPGDSPRLPSELAELRAMLSDDVTIVVGGEGALRHRSFLEENRMRLVTSLAEFRSLLHKIRLVAGHEPLT
jgi:DNA-binding transcriptional MerR regulator/methylmalonyl-CoA mutase cobalamin-binding subunit